MILVCLIGQVKSVIEEILEKLPEEYDVAEMAAKTTQRSPYVLVCFQECERMNLLLAEMRRSLSELALGLKVLAAAYKFKRRRSQGFNQRDRVCPTGGAERLLQHGGPPVGSVHRLGSRVLGQDGVSLHQNTGTVVTSLSLIHEMSFGISQVAVGSLVLTFPFTGLPI